MIFNGSLNALGTTTPNDFLHFTMSVVVGVPDEYHPEPSLHSRHFASLSGHIAVRLTRLLSDA
jgi:hypothetical protein